MKIVIVTIILIFGVLLHFVELNASENNEAHLPDLTHNLRPPGASYNARSMSPNRELEFAVYFQGHKFMVRRNTYGDVIEARHVPENVCPSPKNLLRSFLVHVHGMHFTVYLDAHGHICGASAYPS